MGVVQLRPPKMGGGGRRHVDRMNRIYRIKSFGGWFLSKPGLPYLHPVNPVNPVINIPARIKPKNGAGRKTSPVLRCREYYMKLKPEEPAIKSADAAQGQTAEPSPVRLAASGCNDWDR